MDIRDGCSDIRNFTDVQSDIRTESSGRAQELLTPDLSYIIYLLSYLRSFLSIHPPRRTGMKARNC